MNWKEEFIKLLEMGTFETDSEIDDYVDEHNLPVADVWRCVAEHENAFLIEQSIGTPCEGCEYVTVIKGWTPCCDCYRNKADFYTEGK